MLKLNNNLCERGHVMIHLQVDNVSTIVNRKKLLSDITFSVHGGEVVALVGHNGAGKSTLMKTILGMLKKEDEGQIIIQDEYDQDTDYLAFKKHLTFIPEEPMLLNEMTVMQHFQLYGMSYQIDETQFQEKIARLSEGFELQNKLSVYPEELSKGMRQKVQIICALLPEAPVLLIDEPFMGLDIYAVDYVIELMKEKIANGTSILLTTHQLDQVKDLADQYILLQHGRIEEKGLIEDFDTISRGSENV